MQPYGLLESCRYEDLSANTPVFNVYALEDHIWVHLPRWARFYKLGAIHNISGRISEEVLFDDTTAVQDEWRPWLKLSTSILDLTPGQHIYRLIFDSEPPKSDTQQVFISYITRDNNPKTPYIYMPNRGNPEDPYSKEYNYEEEYVTDD